MWQKGFDDDTDSTDHKTPCKTIRVSEVNFFDISLTYRTFKVMFKTNSSVDSKNKTKKLWIQTPVPVLMVIETLRSDKATSMKTSLKNRIRIILNFVAVQWRQRNTQKAWCKCRVVVLLIKPIVFLTFPLPSQSLKFENNLLLSIFFYLRLKVLSVSSFLRNLRQMDAKRQH